MNKVISLFFNSTESDAQANGSLSDRKKPPLNSRAPRIPVSALHEVAFVYDVNSIKTIVSLANLSATGVGLIINDHFKDFDPFAAVQGKLRMGAKEFSVELKEVWRSSQIIGCAIVHTGVDFANALNQYFRSELAALKMTQMRPELLQSTSNGKPFYFHGGNNCEIYFELDGKKLITFHLDFFGNYIESKNDGSLLFGQIQEDHDYSKAGHKGSEMVHSAPELSIETLKEVIRFVEAVQGIEPEIKREICKSLRNYIEK